MDKEIKKCSICSEPYYRYKGEIYDNACPDCVKKANDKEKRELDQPMQF